MCLSWQSNVLLVLKTFLKYEVLRRRMQCIIKVTGVRSSGPCYGSRLIYLCLFVKSLWHVPFVQRVSRTNKRIWSVVPPAVLPSTYMRLQSSSALASRSCLPILPTSEDQYRSHRPTTVLVSRPSSWRHNGPTGLDFQWDELITHTFPSQEGLITYRIHQSMVTREKSVSTMLSQQNTTVYISHEQTIQTAQFLLSVLCFAYEWMKEVHRTHTTDCATVVAHQVGAQGIILSIGCRIFAFLY